MKGAGRTPGVVKLLMWCWSFALRIEGVGHFDIKKKNKQGQHTGLFKEFYKKTNDTQ
jgi:hypothetical protein